MMLGELVGEFFSYFKFLLTYFGLGLVLENLIYRWITNYLFLRIKRFTVSKFECLDKKNCTLNFMMEIIKY